MGKPEAGIILAIHHLKKDLPTVKECKHVYAHQDTRNAKKLTETKYKRKGMTIDCKIEQTMTQANLDTDYLSNGDKTKHLTESSCSEDTVINNTRKILLYGILSPIKTNHNNADKDDTRKHQNHSVLKRK